MDDDAVQNFLRAIPDKRREGQGWKVRCPAHDDDEYSLKVDRGDDGKVLLKCFAGCTPQEIVGRLGMTMQDLFPAKYGGGSGNNGSGSGNGLGRIINTYNYTTTDGTLLYQSVRFDPKTFRQRKPSGLNNGWIWDLEGVERVLYRLPELKAAPPDCPVFIVEGEKDTERLIALKLIATTNAGGAGKWRHEYSQVLYGRRVVILPDNDEPGRKHARQVAQSLSEIAKEVKIVELPGLPPKGDVSDWLDMGHDVAELKALVEETEEVVIEVADSAAAPGTRSGRTEDYFQALTAAGYTFALNELDDTVEVGGVRLDDIMRSCILNDVRDQGLKSAEWASDAINALAARKRYHPVRDYLNSLKWDGHTDHIGALAWHLKSLDAGWTETVLQHWLIGSVGKALDKRQNFMLVLAGPQNIGKSFLARWLNPLGDRYHVEGPIRPDDKDDRLRLIANLTWEVSELGATTRRADVEALKSFISLRDVMVRKPYGRFDIVKPALASFMGSINHSGSGFLTDTTGNRRFVVMDLVSINRDYSARLEAAQVWAQAVALYKAGETGDLSEEDSAKRDAKNEEYMVENAVEAIFHRTYFIDPDALEWIPSADILQDMEISGLKLNQNEALKRLAELLKKEGVEKSRARILGSGRPNVYRGLRRKPGSLI